MMRHTPILVALVVLAAAPISKAAPYVEQGRAERLPWSGYWWPLSRGGLADPLGVYDQLTGQHAVDWEEAHHPSGANVPHWYGFCHAWAASSIMEAEPRQAQNARRIDGHTVSLGVGCQKGMLAACHTQDVANSYGDRFGDGQGSEDPQDIAPDLLWQTLKLYLGKQRVPLVLDVEAGPEVWNFPVYAYEVRSDSIEDGEHNATMTLWLADDGVAPDFVGCKVRRLSYTFTCTMRGGSVVLGSGHWTGRSVKDHPDFAWSPYLAQAENPEVQQTKIHELLAQGAASPPPDNPASPSNQPAPPPLPGPGIAGQAVILTPVELAALVANRTSSFGLDVTVDRFDGGQYTAGEPISVIVTSKADGYLYLFYLDNETHLSLLYPVPAQDGRIAANVPLVLPAPGSDFLFQVAATPGLHRIKAVVTTQPILLGGLAVSIQQQQFRQQSLQHQDQSQPQEQQAVVTATGEQAPAAVVDQTFRWPPSQQEQVQAILAAYTTQNAAQQIEGIDPHTLLGRFAQDVVVFIVGPASPHPSQGQNGRSSSSQKHPR